MIGLFYTLFYTLIGFVSLLFMCALPFIIGIASAKIIELMTYTPEERQRMKETHERVYQMEHCSRCGKYIPFDDKDGKVYRDVGKGKCITICRQCYDDEMKKYNFTTYPADNVIRIA